MLELEGVHSGYGNIAVLFDISFRLDEGAILGVLGRNGMGKSTLIRAIAGILPAHSGAVRLNGEDIREQINAAVLLGYPGPISYKIANLKILYKFR